MTRVTYDPASGSYFALDATDDDARRIAALDWRPHPAAARAWYTRSPYLAAPLWPRVDAADAVTRQALGWYAWNYQASFAEGPLAGTGVDSVRLPARESDRPYPFQVAGIQLGVMRERMLLADSMGLGKSVQALCVVNLCRPKRIVVACTAALEEQWAWFCDKWLVDPRSITILASGRKNVPDEGILILPYSRGHRFRDRIAAGPPVDFLIMDEAHHVRHPTARQSDVWVGEKGLARTATRVLALTGTPIPNQPLEMYSLLSAMAPTTFGVSREAFQKLYCSTFRGVAKVRTKTGGEVAVQFEKNEGKNEHALNAELRASGLMVRRLKQDVLQQLPPKQTFLLHLTPTAAIDELVREEASLYEMLTTTLVSSKDLIALQGHIAHVRAKLGLLKAPKIAEYLLSLFEGGETHVVCFMLHLEAIEAVRKAFEHKRITVRVLTGAMSPRDRNEQVNLFQQSAGAELLIGQIVAAGEGLTMTRARYVVLGEISWTPSANEQAIDRLHRIGQTRGVLAPVCTFPHAVEENVIRTNARKSLSAQNVLDVNILSDVALATE